jgi:NAD(P)-dependent dehydrogenase (short-subunit alcohol dehydrogenase family)
MTERVAIVTGGTRGIGAAISEVLAADGTHVAAVYAGNHDAARALAGGITAAGGSVSVHPGDITVNLVVPGVFETEMTSSMRPEAQEAIRTMIPLGRRGDPRELAWAVRCLLAEEASYITGSVVTVDGGLSMGA